MNLAQLARKFGQAIAPVRISVSDVNEILGEPAVSALQTGTSWVASVRRSTSGHMLDLEFVAARGLQTLANKQNIKIAILPEKQTNGYISSRNAPRVDAAPRNYGHMNP
jgi:hypothetical protein